MKRQPNVGLMLAQRCRRWASIDTALGQCLIICYEFFFNHSRGYQLHPSLNENKQVAKFTLFIYYANDINIS